jgi:heme/copper-type cytochrome/quinol oxidase subunit 2
MGLEPLEEDVAKDKRLHDWLMWLNVLSAVSLGVFSLLYWLCWYRVVKNGSLNYEPGPVLNNCLNASMIAVTIMQIISGVYLLKSLKSIRTFFDSKGEG